MINLHLRGKTLIYWQQEMITHCFQQKGNIRGRAQQRKPFVIHDEITAIMRLSSKSFFNQNPRDKVKQNTWQYSWNRKEDNTNAEKRGNASVSCQDTFISRITWL